jgi:hypothetical protein
LHVRLVLVPLPHLLVHELLLAVLPALLRFLFSRSATASGHLLTFPEEALQPHLHASILSPWERVSGSLPAEGNPPRNGKTQGDRECLTWVFSSC